MIEICLQINDTQYRTLCKSLKGEKKSNSMHRYLFPPLPPSPSASLSTIFMNHEPKGLKKKSWIFVCFFVKSESNLQPVLSRDRCPMCDQYRILWLPVTAVLFLLHLIFPQLCVLSLACQLRGQSDVFCLVQLCLHVWNSLVPNRYSVIGWMNECVHGYIYVLSENLLLVIAIVSSW